MKVLSKIAAVVVVLVASQAMAVTIAETNFNGRTVAGSTASNLTWTTNGVADPGSLTASHALFDTGDAQNRFAVDRNLHNEGPWTVDIPLMVLGSMIELGTTTVDAFIYNNAGALQGDQRDVDLQLELLDSTLTVLDSDTVLNIYGSGGAAVQPQSVSFDLSGNTLAAGGMYTLRLRAFGQGPGNNAGIDNLAVQGEIIPVPEPATLGLLAAGMIGMGLRRRRQA